MFEESVESISPYSTTIEPYRGYSFFRDNFRSVIIHIRDEKYPMFAGKRVRFRQLKRASKIYYYRRSHTDWEA